MAGSAEYSLKYSFHIPDIRELKPGDMISSSCPPTDTFHNGRSVILSPGGFPLHFTFRLIFDKCLHNVAHGALQYRFRRQLHLEQPSHVPFLPPLTIGPPSPSNEPDHAFSHISFSQPLELVGPQQSPFYGIDWLHIRRLPWHDNEQEWGWDYSGQYRFQLLNEPLDLLAALPPPSSADWTILPTEMISAVLRELPLSDRVSARLVCHAWKRILDTASQAWSNVSHLQSIGRAVVPESPYGYHDGLLHQVRDQKLYKGLGFLTSRKAPIHTLELNQDPYDLYEGLKHLPSVLAQHHIKLKALLFYPTGSWMATDKDAESALVKLIKSQPSLERLSIEAVFVPLPTLYQALPRLRILSLHMAGSECLLAFLAHPPPRLSDLDGLRLSIMVFGGHDPEPAELRELSRFLEKEASDLQRVEGQKGLPQTHTPCGCDESAAEILVWGTGKLSPAAAAFLLTPSHGAGSHHYL